MIVGLTSGTFDLFHHSHLIYLERCKSHCDKLIVGVDADPLVRKLKGEGRPIHGDRHRHSLINSISIVDSAFILQNVEDLTIIAAQFCVDKMFKCEKFRARFREGLRGIHVYGAELAELTIIPDIPGMITTTKIVNAIKQEHEMPIPVKTEWITEVGIEYDGDKSE